MKQLIFALTFFALIFDFGCGNSTSNANTASPTPTPTKEEKKEIADRIESAKQKAIEDYVTKNHKGWTLSGISHGADSEDEVSRLFGESVDSKCLADVPCYLHLTQKNQNKVVAIILREFEKNDGTKYWFVYAANPVDLAQARITQIKDKEHLKTISNLTMDDCQPVIEADADLTPPDDRGDYDNGY